MPTMDCCEQFACSIPRRKFAAPFVANESAGPPMVTAVQCADNGQLVNKSRFEAPWHPKPCSESVAVPKDRKVCSIDNQNEIVSAITHSMAFERPFTSADLVPSIKTTEHPEAYDVNSCHTVKNIIRNFEASGFLKNRNPNIAVSGPKPNAQVAQSFSRKPVRGVADRANDQQEEVLIGRNKAGDFTKVMVQEVGEGQPCFHCNTACSGYKPHAWRNICCRCKCSRDLHDVCQLMINVAERLGLTSSKFPSKANNIVTMQQPDSSVYAWVPPGLSWRKVEEYMAQLPSQKVPKTRTAGEKYRNRQLMLQLPRQDLSAAYCKHLYNNVELRAFEDFVNNRNELALDIGYITPTLDKKADCRKCRGLIQSEDLAVLAPKFGSNACWHPACFTCCYCGELLADLTYCIRDGKLFCERHYAELNKPRCSACDELIFAGEYTKAMNQDWHSGHFCCWQCDTSLTGQRYILREEHPYCIKCYEQVFANTCDECGKPIGIDSKDLSYKEKHWHENCFLCSMCKISLVDKPFGSKNDRIFCANCYDQAFATRCDGCGDIFKAGMKKMEYKGKQWHDKCFCCALCKSPIGTKSFIPKNDEVYCAACYEEKFATRCSKCKKVISSGGVTYKNEPWHKECFCCVNCNSSLAGQRFTSKDDKPYCATCFGELFAKRCTSCTKPITGIGGSKFISFEDRHWHNECFLCAQCKASLVGKGFITDGADILCPECAKARLMAQHS